MTWYWQSLLSSELRLQYILAHVSIESVKVMSSSKRLCRCVCRVDWQKLRRISQWGPSAGPRLSPQLMPKKLRKCTLGLDRFSSPEHYFRGSREKLQTGGISSASLQQARALARAEDALASRTAQDPDVEKTGS